jgi:hypothetical protein
VCTDAPALGLHPQIQTEAPQARLHWHVAASGQCTELAIVADRHFEAEVAAVGQSSVPETLV